jgi:hypothetical protein
MRNNARTLSLLVLLILSYAPAANAFGSGTPPPCQSAPLPCQKPETEAFGRLPLPFLENRGQMDKRILYCLVGPRMSFYFSNDGLTITVDGPDILAGSCTDRGGPGRSILSVEFDGSTGLSQVRGEKPLPTTVNRFTGPPTEWVTGIAAFSGIVYENLWPGIDMVWSGGIDELKYEFVLRPGADPRAVGLIWRGADRVSVTEGGALLIETPAGNIEDAAPLAYQQINGECRAVSASYSVQKRDGGAYACGFNIGSYDSEQTLVIDPSMFLFCGYIGGTNSDDGKCIAIDSNGCSYVAGNVTSTETTFPVLIGPDLDYNGNSDIFIAKINADGTALVYCGYIGGINDEWVEAIAVDGGGNAYLGGQVISDETSFPVVVGPDLTFNGTTDSDAFVARVNAAGTSLDYCGYIGGDAVEYISAISVDISGNLFVAGATYSDESTFPVVLGPDINANGGLDGFVAKVGLTGASLEYCGFVGGVLDDRVEGIAVDPNGNAVLAGMARSDETTFPVAVGPDLTQNGDADAFVARVSAAGTGLDYCGYIGGLDYDTAQDVALDTTGRVYVTGGTSSDESTFPVVLGPSLIFGGDQDAFVAVVNAAGTATISCGYIGGTDFDTGRSIAVDTGRNAYLGGLTRTSDGTFPLKIGPGFTFSGSADGFVAKVSGSDGSLVYCGYIGGYGGDTDVEDVAVDGPGNVYATGGTSVSENEFPVIVGPDLTFNNGTTDAYVAKIPPAHVLVRAGNVNTGAGNPVDVITVNGSSGGDAYRTVTIPSGSQLTISVASPPGGPNPAAFILYIWPGEAGPDDLRELAFGLGTACFTPPHEKCNITPPPFTLVNNIGYSSLLGVPLLPAVPPAPTVLGPFSPQPGIWTLQGFIFDSQSGSGRVASLTNAVVIEIL